MSRWRVAVVAGLFVTPFAALMILGALHLWERGWMFWAWWVMLAFVALSYGLGWYWQRRRGLLKPLDFTPPLAWTERDQEAWKLVEARARDVARIDPDKLTEFQFYVDLGRDMALELARFYHPRSGNPMGNLTVPEVLAAIELSARDLAELVDRYLPGGHLLTINNWVQARQAVNWYSTASTVYWLAYALFSPVETAARYAASQLGVAQPWQRLQENLLLWFYEAYVHRTGTYLIDLNSGRLKVGARRFRELTQDPAALAQAAAASAPQAEPAEQVRLVTLTLMGQVKAGKSSLVNALLGEQMALTDVLPATAAVTRYELQPAGVPTRLVLLDTVGYGHAGPKEDQLRATREAAQQSDLILLVLHARNPARQADLGLLQNLHQWFAERPHLKMPPILGVVTHIDLLSPVMEWAPPYDWQQPITPKEVQIREAVQVVHEQLGRYLVGAVPVCGAPGKVHGAQEWLLPVVTELIDEARAVALLRVLRAEADTGKVRRVFQQMVAAGKGLALALWQRQQEPTRP